MKRKEISFQCGPFNISMEAEQQVQDLLFNLYADFYTFKSASCLPPCKTVEYKAFHKSYDAKSGRDIIFFHGRVFLLDMFIEILKIMGMIKSFSDDWLCLTFSFRGSLIVSCLWPNCGSLQIKPCYWYLQPLHSCWGYNGIL